MSDEKLLKLKDVKKFLNNLTEKELEQEMFVMSQNFQISLPVSKVEKINEPIYLEDGESIYRKSEIDKRFEGYENDYLYDFEKIIESGEVVFSDRL